MNPTQDLADRLLFRWVLARLTGFLAGPFPAAVGWALFLMLAPSSRASEPIPPADAANSTEASLFHRFETNLWPLLIRGEGGSCVSCHDLESKSELRFFEDARSSFRMLLERGYFSPADPDGLLGRVSSTDPKKRMPKGKAASPWNESELDQLRSLAAEIHSELKGKGTADEEFPSALLLPYKSQPARPASDYQFLSYRQLKGKIKQLFDDDWVRNGRDLFQENIALFGGADFTERFNESTKASPTYLAGLQLLARDAASRAYARKAGPFKDRPETLPSPWQGDRPDPAWSNAITALYERLLFRAPLPAEAQEAFALIQSVYRAEAELQKSDFELAFRLTVEDPETGLRAVEDVSVPVSGEEGGLYQELIDQSQVIVEEKAPPETGKPGKRRDRNLSGVLVKAPLHRIFHLRPNEPRQTFKLFNAKTTGNVSFHSVEVCPMGDSETNAVLTISATNNAVQAEGAWKLDDRKGLTSLEDENNEKGSSITVNLAVPQEGEYELTVTWRQNKENAKAVLVEVTSDGPSQLAVFSTPVAPPLGEARFFIDESNDSIAFADLKTSFRFHTNDYVEIGNQGTHRRVTADAVKFVARAGGAAFLVDNDEADGRENWKVYDSGPFKAYNQTGPNSYHDENSRKGELFLRYRPSVRRETWLDTAFYQVLIGYPAKEDHETRTPVIVRAAQSSPIVQIAAPLQAAVGAELHLDASNTYTVQGSPLRFRWEQLSGPAVSVSTWTAASLQFEVPRMGAQQAAWEALCRGLMQHPDFLFTRPTAGGLAVNPAERARFALVQICQDLLGRPPAEAELAALQAGKTLEAMIDEFLQSQEFAEFYFHRIRLYLESHGTEPQDEPARLWCYIAQHDRPFQEILTADYTVDSHWQKQPRPAWHGHTGLLTSYGFMEGKPGLPHFNYAAQVAELFLGYVFEVPPEVVAQREGITAASTTDSSSVCYSCHKILTPLAFQRNRWDDRGRYRAHDEYGLPIDDSDQRLVPSYPFAGEGLEAFATQAVRKERFIRTIINTHFTFYFGREMRFLEDERSLYKRLWDQVNRENFTLRSVIKGIVTSPEYLGNGVPAAASAAAPTATGPTPPVLAASAADRNHN